MIDLWQRWGKAIRGDPALTPGFRCDRLDVQLSDKGSDRQKCQIFGVILRRGPKCVKKIKWEAKISQSSLFSDALAPPSGQPTPPA
jgi:hypothetical protein